MTTQTSEPRSPCLFEETLLDFVQAKLSPKELEHIDRHLDGCDECRALVAEVARGLESSGELTREDRGAPQPILSTGTQIGRYVIQQHLGSGGMGVVYLARDSALNRNVAIKLLRHDRRTDRGAQAQLLREAQAMAGLSHPNVIAIHDVGTQDGQVFIAMEFVDGESLSSWMDRRPRDWREVLEVLAEAGRGLAAAHAAGLVHRDFKPSNVLIGSDGRVRVADFGLARPFDIADEPPRDDVGEVAARWVTLTRTRHFKGTPAYMAPEQFLAKPVTPKTDQFSFCVTMYRSLFGQRPFESKTVEGLLREVLHGNVRSPSSSTDVPSSLRDVVLRGLRSSPEERHESMDVLLESVRASYAPRRTAHASRSRLPRLALAGLVAIVLAIAAIQFSSRFGEDRRDETRPPSLRERAPDTDVNVVGRLLQQDAVSVEAPPIADKRSPKRQRKTRRPRAAASAKCTPNHYFDADGVKHFKPECL